MNSTDPKHSNGAPVIPAVTPTKPVVDPDELHEVVGEAHTLADDIARYSATAADIDHEFERRNEHRNLTLDDMPYGEEQIRARQAAESVRDALKLLRRVESGQLQGEEAQQAFTAAEAGVEDARATLDDCKDLPPDDADADDDGTDDYVGAEDEGDDNDGEDE
jgi:hypothetical protein